MRHVVSYYGLGGRVLWFSVRLFLRWSISDDDHVFEEKGLRSVVDDASLALLEGHRN